MVREKLSHPLRAGALRLIADEVRLQAAQDQEGGVRIEVAAEGAEIGPQAADEIAAADDGPAHDVPGSRGILGQAVDVHVDVEFAVLVKPGKRVVHEGQRVGGFRQAREGGDVGDLRERIRGTLEEHQARGRRGENALYRIDVLDGKHRVPDAEAAEEAPDEIAGRVVGLDEADDVVALPGQREQRL